MAAVAVGEARFGRKGAHATVAAAVPLLASSPGVAAEFTTRLRSVIEGDPHARWTPFAKIRH